MPDPYDKLLDSVLGPAKPRSAYDPDTALDLISKYESGNRNIKQQIVPEGGGYNPSVGRVTGPSSASGPWQITNSTWRKRAPREIAQKYPTAMSAPVEVQREVARKIFSETGFQDWAPFNPRLRRAIDEGEQTPVPKRDAYDDLLDRVMPSEQAQPPAVEPSAVPPRATPAPTPRRRLHTLTPADYEKLGFKRLTRGEQPAPPQIIDRSIPTREDLIATARAAPERPLTADEEVGRTVIGEGVSTGVARAARKLSGVIGLAQEYSPAAQITRSIIQGATGFDPALKLKQLVRDPIERFAEKQEQYVKRSIPTHQATSVLGQVAQEVGRGAGAAAIDLPTIAATAPLGVVNLPLHFASEAKGEGKGAGAQAKGVAEGLVYHFGMGLTAPLGRVRNALIWGTAGAAQSAAEQGLTEGRVDLASTIASGLTMAGLSSMGGKRVQVRDVDGVRSATVKDLRRIKRGTLEVVPPEGVAEHLATPPDDPTAKQAWWDMQQQRAANNLTAARVRLRQAKAEQIPAAQAEVVRQQALLTSIASQRPAAVTPEAPDIAQPARRIDHAQFGRVTEAPDQSGVPRRKVRVVADDGTEHVIQRPNGRGQGNNLAVPVRETPTRTAEPTTQPEAATPTQPAPSATEAAAPEVASTPERRSPERIPQEDWLTMTPEEHERIRRQVELEGPQAEQPLHPLLEGEPAAPTPEVVRLPEIREGENYRQPLNKFGSSLYRESSPSKALEMLPTSPVMTDVGEVYLANTPDLALGQGRNKGVVLEFEPAELQGRVNTSKPAWKQVYDQGQAELIGTYNKQGDYQNALKSVTVRPDVQMSRLERQQMNRALQGLEAQGWTKTKTPEGVRYERPAEVAKPAPEPSVAARPEPTEEMVRLYRADAADAPTPQGKGWANDPEYVSKKYGKGELSSGESIWYIDVPKKALDAEYGDWRSMSVIDSDALRTMGVSVEPKLYRRTEITPGLAARPTPETVRAEPQVAATTPAEPAPVEPSSVEAPTKPIATEPKPDIAKLKQAFTLPLITEIRRINKPLEVVHEDPNGRQIKRTIKAKDVQGYMERKQKLLDRLVDCLHA